MRDFTVNIMTADDALGPYVARLSAATILTMWDSHAFEDNDSNNLYDFSNDLKHI